MPFTDVFGGSTLQAAQVAYRSVSLTASVALSWPQNATDANVIARLMNVTANNTGYVITLDTAAQVSPGQDIFFNNVGANAFTVHDNAGGVIATVSAGQVKYLYLTDNSTAAGTWSVTTLGVGTSSPDAASLAGYGIRALSTTLNFAPVVSTFSASAAVAATDRAKVFVWTGGSGTLTLPALATASSLADWEIEVRNQGTGTLTIATTGGEQIDAAASISLAVSESCFVHSGPAAWYTVGRGRNTSFNFTKLTKSVTGGTTTLSQTEASNVIQVYSGALLSNETVVVPATVQVYYITNNTTGAYTFTVKSPITGGSTVVITQAASAIIYCDGTNIINCNTSGVTINAVSLAAGSAGSPSLSFSGDSTTGVYQPASGQFAVTISGTQRMLITATGINNTAIGATTPTTGAFTTATATSLNKVAVTAPATGSTLTIADGKTLTANSSLTLAGTDGKTLTTSNSGTLAGGDGFTLAIAAGKTLTASNSLTIAGVDATVMTFPGASDTVMGLGAIQTVTAAKTFNDGKMLLAGATSGTLSLKAAGVAGTNTITFPAGTVDFSATGGTAQVVKQTSAGGAFTVAQLAASDLSNGVTGSGAMVLANTPTLITPVLGVATATSINKVALTAPATSATLTIADGKTLTASNTLTLTGTDASSVAFGAGGTVVYTGSTTSSGLTMATSRLLGRTTAATGAIEEISIGSGLTLAAGSLSAAGSGGTVTSVSVTTQNGVSGTVTNPTTTPALAFTLGAITPTSVNGLTISTTTGTLTLTNGKTLSVSNTVTLAGTDGSTYTLPGASASIGYLNVPQNSQSAAYTTVLADSGKHILHPSTDANARTFTIDSNANVAYPVGTTITFINQTSQVVTIAITSDTLTLAGTTTTGSRSLGQNGVATAIKVAATSWIISGSGLT